MPAKLFGALTLKMYDEFEKEANFVNVRDMFHRMNVILNLSSYTTTNSLWTPLARLPSTSNSTYELLRTVVQFDFLSPRPSRTRIIHGTRPLTRLCTGSRTPSSSFPSWRGHGFCDCSLAANESQ
ncbi:hypothetical protein BC936DRAFT_147408 [Jimgerdemannia flammicorona]|uniref:Uncharacterized protein n=1 Tax=Jimgerdemannia flammicorona TaxID=994334 RepID=A0A433D5F5_9FUNG|nr:hypothetical protein BC936DRAFT_147408 [Jimgerdemannia flammicorona]